MNQSIEHANFHFSCAKHFFEDCFPRPVRAIAATVKIERGRAKFGIGVTRKMRLRKQCETTHAARVIELVPGDFAEHVQIEIAYDAIENRAESIEVCKRLWVAPACVDEPFRSESHKLRERIRQRGDNFNMLIFRA